MNNITYKKDFLLIDPYVDRAISENKYATLESAYKDAVIHTTQK